MISNLCLNFPRTEQKAQFSKSQSQKNSSRDLNLFTLSISVHFLRVNLPRILEMEVFYFKTDNSEN